MKSLIYTALTLAAFANAQTVECPKLFPADDTVLPEPTGGNAVKARVRKSRLSFAYMQFGEVFGEQTLVGPKARRVNGGWDSEYGFSPQDSNWLVCRFGGSAWGSGDIELWQKLRPGVSSCVLKIRQAREPHLPSAWSASAICR